MRGAYGNGRIFDRLFEKGLKRKLAIEPDQSRAANGVSKEPRHTKGVIDPEAITLPDPDDVADDLERHREAVAGIVPGSLTGSADSIP